MESTQVTITINGKSHQLNTADPESIRRLPWEDRKQLIGVLEHIKQAEYVQQSKAPETPRPYLMAVKTTPQTDAVAASETASLKSTAKAPEDVDVLMSQLIIEDRKNRTQIPDRVVVVKWMLVILAVIIGLSLLF
jgi:hypothetical protein